MHGGGVHDRGRGVHGRGACMAEGACVLGGTHGRGYVWQGHAWQWGRVW